MERCVRKCFLFYEGYGFCYAVWTKHNTIAIKHFISQKKTTTICYGQIEYNIEFNDTYQFYHEEKLSQNKIYFSLPISKNFIFTPLKNNIQLINESDDTYTFIITYNDSNNKDFYMTLQIKKDFSKELSMEDTYENSFYIYRNCNSKFSIHNNKFVKSAPTWKKLIGIIDFDQEDDEIYQNNFMKAYVK